MKQENESRQLIEYLRLPWDKKCLDFHLNKSSVGSLSNLQIRQTMYNKSINRWKQYEKNLKSPIDILQKHN